MVFPQKLTKEQYTYLWFIHPVIQLLKSLMFLEIVTENKHLVSILTSFRLLIAELQMKYDNETYKNIYSSTIVF